MRRNSNHLCRRAAAMIMALVVLLVVGMVSGLALRAILQSHRQTRQVEQRVQAELLADAALSRAMSMLGIDANWKGETWTVNLRNEAVENEEAKDLRYTGVAVTQVQTNSEVPNSLRISVTAIYPGDPVHRAQARRQVSYPVSPRGEKP